VRERQPFVVDDMENALCCFKLGAFLSGNTERKKRDKKSGITKTRARYIYAYIYNALSLKIQRDKRER